MGLPAVKPATYDDILALPETAWFELAPDWICEILSPSTAKLDRAVKLPLYARNGVTHCWLVDPDLKTLEVFENRDGKWLLLTVLENDAEVSQPPFRRDWVQSRQFVGVVADLRRQE